MDLNEIKTYFETNKENEEVKNYLQGLNKITLDGVKNFLETNENGKGYLQSYTDSKVTKGIETFKTNTLPNLVEEELKKRNPSSTDPRDLEIQELRKIVEDSQKQTLRKDLEIKISKIASEKNIPIDLIPYVLDSNSDEESTLNNLKVLEKALGDYSQIIRSQILKEGSYTPKKNFNSNNTVNPYIKETFSLTKQSELEKSNKELALQFQNQLNG